MTRLGLRIALFCGLASLLVAPSALAERPNILLITADDLSWDSVGVYGCPVEETTPNIDQLAEEGAMFTDYYGDQGCTPGRSAFTTGQSPFRVGLTKVGMPGAKQGISDEDPTLAQLLKPHGYGSGQFGKNHPNDRQARRDRGSALQRG